MAEGIASIPTKTVEGVCVSKQKNTNALKACIVKHTGINFHVFLTFTLRRLLYKT